MMQMMSMKKPEKNFDWLVGTWYPCEVEYTFFSPAFDPMPSGTDVRTCSSTDSNEIVSLNAPENTSFLSTSIFFDRFACPKYSISDCPNADNELGAAMLRHSAVSTIGPSRTLQKTTVFIADYEEYLNSDGEWVPTTRDGITWTIRLTCDLTNKDQHELLCSGENDVMNPINGFQYAFAFSTKYVRDLADCEACYDV